MKTYRICCATAVILGCTISVALSQANNAASALAGLRVLDIVTEEVRVNNCNISRLAVDRQLRSIIGSSRIQVSKDADEYIYLNVNVTPSCTATDISLSVRGPATLTANGAAVAGVAWEQGFTLSGAGDMDQRVRSDIERMARSLIVDWSSVNP